MVRPHPGSGQPPSLPSPLPLQAPAWENAPRPRRCRAAGAEGGVGVGTWKDSRKELK